MLVTFLRQVCILHAFIWLAHASGHDPVYGLVLGLIAGVVFTIKDRK